jgi:hypothetical protein
MDETGNLQNQRWAVAAGVIALLYFLNKMRKRRKMKKIIEERLKARMEAEREKSVSGKVKRRLVAETKGRKRGKKAKKEKSMMRSIVRAVLFQLAKKMIMEQLGQAEFGIKGLKPGKKRAHEAAETSA